MKILVDKKEIETLFLATANVESVSSIHNKLKQILTDSPVVKDYIANGNKKLTPEETVEFLIEITDTLATYLWNKKEEATTHQYAKYLDELREKLEEYGS